jgi:hypothetical protein
MTLHKPQTPTPNPKLQTPNLKPQTSNPKPQTKDQKPKTKDLPPGMILAAYVLLFIFKNKSYVTQTKSGVDQGAVGLRGGL